MKIDVYTSSKNSRKFLSVKEDCDVSELAVPDDFDPDLRKVSPFKSKVDLDITGQRIGIDVADVKQQIARRGYAIHGTTNEIPVGGHKC